MERQPTINKLFQLLIVIFVLMTLSDSGRCDGYAAPQFHLESIPTDHFKCVLAYSAFAPNLWANEWLVIAPLPQDSPSQTVNSATLTIDNASSLEKTALDNSSQQRPVQESMLFVSNKTLSHSLELSASYDVILKSRCLEAGPSTEPIAPLSDVERDEDTAPTPTTNFTSPVFQAWLDKNCLRRQRGEDDLSFARQTFEKIRDLYSYCFDPAQDRSASAVCNASTADCGGLSNLFVAVMRQASIPARLDAGRWVLPGTQDGALSDVHVKSEFYVDGVGWVPVEMSGAVSDKNGDESLYFGRDTGQFLTMSVNTDYVIDAQQWGTKRILALQGICCWGAGIGDFSGFKENDSWSVTKVNGRDDAELRTVGTSAPTEGHIFND